MILTKTQSKMLQHAKIMSSHQFNYNIFKIMAKKIFVLQFLNIQLLAYVS